MLHEAIRKSKKIADSLGAAALIVHPISERANLFWVLQGKMARFSPKVERLATDIAHH